MDDRWVELEFRDGKRPVPDYLASMMSGIETHRLTYQQAIDAANKKVEADHINARQDRFITEHFKEYR